MGEQQDLSAARDDLDARSTECSFVENRIVNTTGRVILNQVGREGREDQ